MQELAGDAPAALKREKFPDWIAPMLCTLTEEYFSDPQWIFERKLDGVRVLAYKQGPEVRLYSRNRILQNSAYPEVVEAVGRQPADDLILDGEVVAFSGKQTSFSLLQGRLGLQDPDAARARGIDIDYYVFDILHLDGYSLRDRSLLERKAALKHLLATDRTVRFTEHRLEKGERFLATACESGWEGLIAKRASSSYEPGQRSRDWLKFKCSQGQEFVIAGYTDPQGSRQAFGALLLGYFDDEGQLHYAGKVGTGFDDRELAKLGARFKRLARMKQPFNTLPLDEPDAHWLKPELVAQIGFTEWTRDGKLRHPRFLGLRTDKPARQVVKEVPANAS